MATALAMPGLAAPAPAAQQEDGTVRLAFLGLHGGVFGVLQEAAEGLDAELDVKLASLEETVAGGGVADLSVYDLVLVQHLRVEDSDRLRALLTDALGRRPDLRVISISGMVASVLPELASRGVVEHDPAVAEYYRAAGPENMRRLLTYLLVKRFGAPGEIEPPVEPDEAALFHPDHEGAFADAADFRAWMAQRGTGQRPVVAVAVHRIHRLIQQPRVVAALVQALEERGLQAAVVEDNGPLAGPTFEALQPDVVVHTCHAFDDVAHRVVLDVPHLHSIFNRRQSIEEYSNSRSGLPAGDIAFQITSQELLGAIEPVVAAGTLHGASGAEDFTPLPERIGRVADRAAAWASLRHKPNAEKHVALIYYNREMGKADLMRGSATGMFLNAPRSMVRVLARMAEEGYDLPDRPADEDDLIERLIDHGQQIGLWDPAALDALARSGQAVLVNENTYRRWYEERVPAHRRAELEQRWGQPPGRIQVWTDDDGQRFFVFPRIDLGGGVILLPQPMRGEAHTTAMVHDRRVPPSHNYLATYFWLEHAFGADALVHFGTHGTEFLLPGKGTGMGSDDWSDLLLGTMPNITLWAVHNLGESAPARRRAYAVLVDHLVPPSVQTALPDELENLQGDIERYRSVEDGALRQGFLQAVTDGVHATGLDTELDLGLPEGAQLAPEQVDAVLEYLHDLAEQTTPTRLHHLGEPPREDERVPWITLCLGASLRDALSEMLEPVPPADGEPFLRDKACQLVDLVVRHELEPRAALATVVGEEAPEPSEELLSLLATARTLDAGLIATGNELDHLLDALSGRFVPPGPGNSPDRNPASVPTGRNLYTLNPREVPSRPSWNLARKLVDDLLARRLAERGDYPQRVGFDISSFATFRDYGVMEAQILYLLGVRPMWDGRNQVHSVELIPAEELGRPRIDVMIATGPYYRDMLPGRMRLLDAAVRQVSALDEPDNRVLDHSERARTDLLAQGVEPGRAGALSRARLFGYPPGQLGSASYSDLVEKSGDWDTREDLARIYTEHSSHVYTEGLWGEHAPRAYAAALRDTEIVLRTWSDRTLSPLSNKYMWYRGGSLCRAVESITGNRPDFLLTDVRDPGRAGTISAEQALARDFRVRLLNRAWAEGMMREGYAGADQVAKAVSNCMGWSIMRPGSVGAAQFEGIVDAYLRDRWQIGVREWFEAENPFALQELAEILLESVRKGYWDASPAMRAELAREYASSVARHGEGGGLLGGGNTKLERFVEQILQGEGSGPTEALLAAYRARHQAKTAQAAGPESASEVVEGRELEPSAPPQPVTAAPVPRVGLWAGLLALALVTVGFRLRQGVPGA